VGESCCLVFLFFLGKNYVASIKSDFYDLKLQTNEETNSL